GREIPFVFARADELVDDHLRAVGKIAKLRFPQYQRFGTVPAKAILETEAARLGKRGIVDFAESLRRRKVGERKIIVLIHCVDQHRMALIERASLRVLPGEADGIAFQDDGAKRQSFRESVVYGALAVAHLGALFEQLHNFRMNVKAL